MHAQQVLLPELKSGLSLRVAQLQTCLVGISQVHERSPFLRDVCSINVICALTWGSSNNKALAGNSTEGAKTEKESNSQAWWYTLQSQLLGKLRQKDLLNPRVLGCSALCQLDVCTKFGINMPKESKLAQVRNGAGQKSCANSNGITPVNNLCVPAWATQ